ncbi:MAG TPA: 2Fe-2S iron-sulfur cluster-binding protein [Anaerolineae bacterium]
MAVKDNGRPGPKTPITFKIFRYKPGFIDPPRLDTFQVDVDKRMTILDALEDIRTAQDATLMYRHSCHHGSCGTCAMKVNGREILSCVTNVLELGTAEVTVEPLSVLPLVCDLVVDMTYFADHFAPMGMNLIRKSEFMPEAVRPEGIAEYTRYEQCLECAACVSACPIVNTDPTWTGPAALGAASRAWVKGDSPAKQICELVDHEHGAWRCHEIMECSSVCPNDVDPGGLIMSLRRRMVGYKLRRLFGRE